MTAEILRGTVLTTADPLGVGRVKITVPQITGRAGIWAAALQNGAAATPAPGSAVWVLHESGDLGLPVYVPVTAYTPWTPVPGAWLAGPFLPGTGAYRLGPGAIVEFAGELTTANGTGATLANGTAVLNLPSAMQPALPASYPAPLSPGAVTSSTSAVLRVVGATGTLYGGSWMYTGVVLLSLSALAYCTEGA